MFKRVVRGLSSLALAGALFVPTATPSFAAMMVAPSPQFGAHVAHMAADLQHPVEHGGLHFAECVSAMATGRDCPHEM